MGAERDRLEEKLHGRAPWRRVGPYLSERAWGTVREDYSASGDAWRFFSHDDARSRVFRRSLSIFDLGIPKCCPIQATRHSGPPFARAATSTTRAPKNRSNFFYDFFFVSRDCSKRGAPDHS